MMHEPVLGADDLAVVVFQWSTKHGPCHDCGLPAAYVQPNAYGPKSTAEPPKLCAVCAADVAAGGAEILRIEDLQTRKIRATFDVEVPADLGDELVDRMVGAAYVQFAEPGSEDGGDADFRTGTVTSQWAPLDEVAAS